MGVDSFRGFKNPPTPSVLLAQHRTLALKYPCRLAVETFHPRFRFLLGGHGVILTVNTGYE